MDNAKTGETSLDKSDDLRKTYIISTKDTSAGKAGVAASASRGRLALQRRKTHERDQTETPNENREKLPALQRRSRATAAANTPRRTGAISRVLSEPNNRTPSGSVLPRAHTWREAGFKSSASDVSKPVSAAATVTVDRESRLGSSHVTGDRIRTFSTPTGKTTFERVSVKKEVFERLTGKDAARPTGGEKERATGTDHVGKNTTAQANGSQATTVESVTGCEAARAAELKMENSALTVAVRLRPFSLREKGENGHQVIFMDNQETVVCHPNKQSYTFSFDFCFCSVDESNPSFASQQMIYQKLARPLLERAFEGFNTCLFAYGQTGSGKSYTMMGFGEEAGVIPRFCEELFSMVARAETTDVTCHVEMNYFEIYNEKIHDLLVAKDEQNHKKMPLRVREHPVDGPYVEDLSTNVVSSYADVQAWLELGNKQRATAATGMNDKSSRSHSVFTLVMTQTKTELVEGEKHDHRIISRINLVDLAGSERCSTSQSTGDRLREGVSINKSLLTLGKVISALCEQAQSKKKVFTPYRESVLTWLLKESLGGNSKTAMIATLSPAATNIDESLSTLRYAQQARLIVNVAKVNEDTNAKLIRELKAEVEKLRAAQMSSHGIDPEKVRLYQSEITALKSQLSQQEREMAEVHRTWKLKLEQAEKRKQEETKELQRVGISFKVDSRLPSLVNLNEDPQLSEMLLYVIKEGQTKVGNLKSPSAHDIQLCGALIAELHCVISNVNGSVSITPMKNAKTFVNGNLLSNPTVLHHGDRVILGGDHYFRLNHPIEMQRGKRVNSGGGHKDFEFAKNELLSAQRAQLEAEIEGARLKAKEEMMQGIQMAKEVAQKELSDQKLQYENKIRTLEFELREENERKQAQEAERQKVATKMEELQTAKTWLEQEMCVHKKRLQMEAQAARQAMLDSDIRHAKILEALEAEKRKIAEDLEEIQRKRALKANQTPKTVAPQWDALKLSLMIEEANKISVKFRKHTVFSRHEVPSEEDKGGAEMQIQVQNTKLGISTFWSLEKFRSNLAAMRELEQGNCTSKDDDVFYDPNDEWEPDISSVSSSSLSRRRSRSLLKNKRISGRLYEIRVHPIQSLNYTSSQSTEVIGASKPSSRQSSGSDSALPGICKDLIAMTLCRLRTSASAEEHESLADKLALDLLSIHNATNAVVGLYEQLDDNTQENLFTCSAEAQTYLVKATSAIERSVFIIMQWASNINPSTQSTSQTVEELKMEVRKIGGYFQLLIQGCDSEISSMVTEAQRKMGRSVEAAVSTIALLAAVTGTQLHLSDLGSRTVGKKSAAACLLKGGSRGVRALLQEGLSVSQEMLRHAQLAQPRTQLLQNLKTKMVEVADAVQNYIRCNMSEESETLQDASEDASTQLEGLTNTAAKLFELNQNLRQLHSSLSRTLRGRGSDAGLSSFREEIQSLSKAISNIIHGLPRQTDVSPANSLQLPCLKSILAARDGVQLALCSLASDFDQSYEDNKELSVSGESGHGTKNRTVPKVVYSLSSGVSSCSRDVRWV